MNTTQNKKKYLIGLKTYTAAMFILVFLRALRCSVVGDPSLWADIWDKAWDVLGYYQLLRYRDGRGTTTSVKNLNAYESNQHNLNAKMQTHLYSV